MADGESIESVVVELLQLLRAHGEERWADALERLAGDLQHNPSKVTKGAIRSIYRGLGSFTDLVLVGVDGKMPIADNDRLDRLRSRLFELSWEGQ